MVYVPLAPVTAAPPPLPPSEDIAETQTSFRPLGLKASVTVPEIDPAVLKEALTFCVAAPLETSTGVAFATFAAPEYHWGKSEVVTVPPHEGSNSTVYES